VVKAQLKELKPSSKINQGNQQPGNSLSRLKSIQRNHLSSFFRGGNSDLTSSSKSKNCAPKNVLDFDHDNDTGFIAADSSNQWINQGASNLPSSGT
jgi:hypothetical protein